MKKECNKCGEENPHYEDKSKSSGYASTCRVCCDKRRRKNERVAAYKSAYGITIDEYDLNLELQDNACKICKVDASEFTKRLSVDHCHTTGEVRGLLCPSCNRGLGDFKDNIEFLEEAIGYLQNSKFFRLS